MYKQILINVELLEKRVAILEDNMLEEFYVERSDQQKLVGSIYKGKVSTILPGMGAAFVDLGLKKHGFLHVSDVVERPPDLEDLISEPLEEETAKPKDKESMPHITDILKKDQEIMVQIVKEPIGTKGPRLTTHISLPARFMVLMPYENHIGVSRRIENKHERARIKKELASLRLPKDAGFIVRTAGSGCGRRVFADETRYLLSIWDKIKSDAEKVKAPGLIHQEYDLVLRVMRDLFTKDINRLVVDSKEEYKKIAHFVNSVTPSLRMRIKYYRGEKSLFERFGIEKEIDKIYENKIYLKNKGYIIIEQTEGMVTIDVNTGKFVGKENLESTAFATNQEAAREVARQIRLRDIGGIIVIDFIDMDLREHRQEVFNTLKRSLKRDKARTKVLGISALGVVEMTRQRMRKSVESISYRECPYCSGRGSVKSEATMSIEVKRKLAQVLKKWPRKPLVLYVHPDVYKYLMTQDKGSISFLENRYRRKIVIRHDPDFHIEQVKIDALDK